MPKSLEGLQGDDEQRQYFAEQRVRDQINAARLRRAATAALAELKRQGEGQYGLLDEQLEDLPRLDWGVVDALETALNAEQNEHLAQVIFGAVSFKELIDCANALKSEDGENPEYDRALLELCSDAGTGDRATVALLFGRPLDYFYAGRDR